MRRDRAQPGVGGLSRTGVGGRAGGLEESRHRGGRARGGRVVRAAAAVRSRLPGTAGARSPSDHARQPGAAVAQWSGVASRCVRASTMRGSLWKRVPLVSSPLPRDIMMCVARASCRTRSSTRAWARRRPCLGPACAAPARTARAGRCSWPAKARGGADGCALACLPMPAAGSSSSSSSSGHGSMGAWGHGGMGAWGPLAQPRRAVPRAAAAAMATRREMRLLSRGCVVRERGWQEGRRRQTGRRDKIKRAHRAAGVGAAACRRALQQARRGRRPPRQQGHERRPRQARPLPQRRVARVARSFRRP